MCNPRNTCFLGPTRVHNPNGTLISSATFTHSSWQNVVRHARICPFP